MDNKFLLSVFFIVAIFTTNAIGMSDIGLCCPKDEGFKVNVSYDVKFQDGILAVANIFGGSLYYYGLSVCVHKNLLGKINFIINRRMDENVTVLDSSKNFFQDIDLRLEQERILLKKIKNFEATREYKKKKREYKAPLKNKNS